MEDNGFDHKILRSMFKLVKKFSHVTHKLKRHNDLSLLQIRILFEIHKHKEINMTELADIMGVSAATMNSHIENLCELGYVEREHEEGDRRIVKVSLCKNCLRKYQRLYRSKFGKYKKILGILSTEDKQHLLSIFEKITNSF
jgi:DNA-binding MarR family transcriptional regulator